MTRAQVLCVGCTPTPWQKEGWTPVALLFHEFHVFVPPPSLSQSQPVPHRLGSDTEPLVPIAWDGRGWGSPCPRLCATGHLNLPDPNPSLSVLSLSQGWGWNSLSSRANEDDLLLKIFCQISTLYRRKPEPTVAQSALYEWSPVSADSALIPVLTPVDTSFQDLSCFRAFVCPQNALPFTLCQVNSHSSSVSAWKSLP